MNMLNIMNGKVRCPLCDAIWRIEGGNKSLIKRFSINGLIIHFSKMHGHKGKLSWIVIEKNEYGRFVYQIKGVCKCGCGKIKDYSMEEVLAWLEKHPGDKRIAQTVPGPFPPPAPDPSSPLGDAVTMPWGDLFNKPEKEKFDIKTDACRGPDINRGPRICPKCGSVKRANGKCWNCKGGGR
jgi:hypothetical protein